MRPHTLASIAEAHGVNKRAAQDWLKKARANKSMLTEDIGEIIGGTRHFSDEERDLLLQYAGEPRRKDAPAENKTAQTEVVQTEVFGSGITLYQPGGLTTRVYDSSAARQTQQGQLTTGFQQLRQNKTALRAALLQMAEEEGVQLGHEAIALTASKFMETYQQGLGQLGKQTGATQESAAS